MALKNIVRSAAAVAAVVALAGCMPKMTREQFREEIKKSKNRPAELDRLNAFAGKWQFEGTAKFAMLDGPPLKMWGTSEGRWEGNNWYLVSTGDFNMEEVGAMKGGEAWTYDSKSKVYRQIFVEEGGTSGSGTATYDAGTHTWKMESHRYGGMGDSCFKGECKEIDANTMQFTGSEYSGLTKFAEFEGTMRRVGVTPAPGAAPAPSKSTMQPTTTPAAK